MLATVRRKVSDLFPSAKPEQILEFLRQEIVPVLREIRESINSATSGPVLYGRGAPVDAPSFGRAIYIDLDGGALTTLYVYEGPGPGWVAK